MAVITISRQFGAGGITLGKKIAKQLGYSFYDSEIIQRVAKQANVSTRWVESMEKEAGGKMQRIIYVTVFILQEFHGSFPGRQIRLHR